MIDELFAGDVGLLLLVQGTACVAVCLAVSYLLRRRPAHAHQVLLTGLAAAVLMPGLYLWAWRCGVGVLAPRTAPPMPEVATDLVLPASLQAAGSVYDPTPGTVAEAVPASSSIARRIPWSAVAAAGWLMVTLALLLRLSLRFLLGAHLLRTAAPLDAEPVTRTIEQARCRLGIEAPVRLRGSAKVRSPVIWCWVREPVLLLQRAAADCPQGTDWAGVFCHELAHWRRRDHLTGLFAEVLTALFPWHLLLWWARGRLLTLSEQACDDWVLATGHRGEDYAETLLGLAAQRRMAFLPAVRGWEKTMNTRIRRIINDRCSNPRIGKRWTLGVSCAALLVSVGVALAQEAPAPPPVEPTPAQTSAPPLTRPQALAPVGEARFQAEAYPLKYISGRKLQGLAEILIGGSGKVVAHADQGPLPGPLLVRTTPENHRRLERLVLLLDVPAEDLVALGSGRNVTQIFQLKHAGAVRLRDALRPVFEKSVEISADERTNSLVVTAPEANIARIRVAIEALDAPAAEVGREPQAWDVKPLLDKLSPEKAGAEKQPGAEPSRRVQETPATPQRTRRLAAGTEGTGRPEARVYALEHISPARMQAIVEALIEEPGIVSLYANGKKATVVTTIENHYRLERIIRTIDVPEEEYLANVRQDGRAEQARLITLKYFPPARMQNIIRAMLDQAGGVELDERTRTLYVWTTRANMRRVESLIQALDTPVDDRVLEAEVEELREQMRRLGEQMQQIQNRLDQIGARDRPGRPADRRGEVQATDKPPATVKIFKLQNADPHFVRAVVEPLLREPESVTAMPQPPGEAGPLGGIGGWVADKPALAVYAAGENMARIERIIRILDVPEEETEAGQFVTMSFKLEHFDPNRMRDVIRPLLGKSGIATVDTQSSHLVIIASVGNFQRIKKVMAELDAPSAASEAQAQTDDLRRQMQQLREQRQQIQNRFDQITEATPAARSSTSRNTR
jgi:type II secretory pathway component GspD/PulD (secretin)/beta-lactamase regulating signal transducer with metallopeptidase domain